MPKVGFFIQKDKINKYGFTAIKAIVTINYKNVGKTVGNIKPKHWNPIKQRVNKSRADEPYNDYEEINQELDKFKNEAETFMKETSKSGIDLTPEMIKVFFNRKVEIKKDEPKINFWDAWREYLENAKLTKATKTVKDQTSTMNYFKNFEKETGTKLSFDSMNLTIIDSFNKYVIERKNQHHNYLSTLTRRLKSFLNWSFERGYNNNNIYRRFKVAEKPGTVVTLTVEEFQKLYQYKFEKNRLDKVRDIFCFGCLTGLRISDLLRLNTENLKGDFIVTYMKKVKTEKPLQIPILPQAKNILEKYKDQYYLLPKISEQKFNEYIKEAAQLAEINSLVKIMHFKTGLGQEKNISKDKMIHAHMTRKTFISLAHKAGVDIETIKDITGIKSEKTLKRYLIIEPETTSNNLKPLGKMMEN